MASIVRGDKTMGAVLVRRFPVVVACSILFQEVHMVLATCGELETCLGRRCPSPEGVWRALLPQPLGLIWLAGTYTQPSAISFVQLDKDLLVKSKKPKHEEAGAREVSQTLNDKRATSNQAIPQGFKKPSRATNRENKSSRKLEHQLLLSGGSKSVTLIPAIVLTYDDHMLFAEHMINQYEKLWPTHPFVFYVPYNDQRPLVWSLVSHHKVKFVKTPKSIRATVLGLLDACDCRDEIIYWAMDDYYPKTVLDSSKLDALVPYVLRESSHPSFVGLALSWNREDPLPKNHTIDDRVLVGRLDRSWVHRNNAPLWVHSFWREGMIRSLFEKSQDKPTAKEWEAAGRKFLLSTSNNPKLRLLRLAEPVVIFGESTHRNRIDSKAKSDLEALGQHIPPKFLPATWAAEYYLRPRNGNVSI